MLFFKRKMNTNENITQITLSNNKKYTVRKSRNRYFFPDEWKKFINSFKNEKHILLYNTLLHTGARIMEALHIKVKDIDFNRETITLKITKTRAANKKLFATGSSRTFFVSKKLLRLMKKYINQHSLQPDEYIFLDNQKLPNNYEKLSNKEKLKYFNRYKVSYLKLLKSHLKKIGIKDYYNFSLHNIRKTYGNWMRIFDIRIEEICFRMGHDLQTFMSNYGSSLLFNNSEKLKIQQIMGEIK